MLNFVTKARVSTNGKGIYSILLAVLLASMWGCSDSEERVFVGGEGTESAGSDSGSTGAFDTATEQDTSTIETTDTGIETETDETSQSGCSDQAKPIYVVDKDGTLYTFDPPSKSFTAVGELDCPSYATPLSMSVTRDAVAYVLYDRGRLFKVDTSSAHCEGEVADLWTGAQETRGMGFATIGNSDDERLYTFRRAPDPAQLAYIDTETWKVTPIGKMTGRPELTGTGDGELWGFFAAAQGGPQVARIDPDTGELLESFDAGGVGAPNTWAFAFWGGEFYIFSKDYDQPSTTVYKMTGDGELTVFMSDTGKTIVGAGVSTCAPLTPV